MKNRNSWTSGHKVHVVDCKYFDKNAGVVVWCKNKDLPCVCYTRQCNKKCNGYEINY